MLRETKPSPQSKVNGNKMVVLEEELIDLAKIRRDAIPATAVEFAQLSLFDWIVCGVAGANQPLSQKLRKMAEHEGSSGGASVFGEITATARMAALINGATSHALDYDDTHFAHIGHLSVVIYPAALAAGEDQKAPVLDVIHAFTVGAEAAIRVGIALGSDHYNMGFHQTATAGAFGATIAAGRLHNLDEQQIRYAIGLCSTRACGLKSQFGTMGKPYNAGAAAAIGVECAQLANLGFTSCENGLTGPQGFLETHVGSKGTGGSVSAVDGFLFCQNKYKLHACCHGLHATIEALSKVSDTGIGINDVQSLSIETNSRWLRVCDKKQPKTGLEVKFSYAWLAGMVLRGDDTGSDTLYVDELADDPELIAFSKKVYVIGADDLNDMQVRGEIVLVDGKTVPFYFDLAEPIAPKLLAERLRKKAISILGARGEEIWRMYDIIDEANLTDISRLLSPTQRAREVN